MGFTMTIHHQYINEADREDIAERQRKFDNSGIILREFNAQDSLSPQDMVQGNAYFKMPGSSSVESFNLPEKNSSQARPGMMAARALKHEKAIKSKAGFTLQVASNQVSDVGRLIRTVKQVENKEKAAAKKTEQITGLKNNDSATINAGPTVELSESMSELLTETSKLVESNTEQAADLIIKSEETLPSEQERADNFLNMDEGVSLSGISGESSTDDDLNNGYINPTYGLASQEEGALEKELALKSGIILLSGEEQANPDQGVSLSGISGESSTDDDLNNGYINPTYGLASQEEGALEKELALKSGIILLSGEEQANPDQGVSLSGISGESSTDDDLDGDVNPIYELASQEEGALEKELALKSGIILLSGEEQANPDQGVSLSGISGESSTDDDLDGDVNPAYGLASQEEETLEKELARQASLNEYEEKLAEYRLSDFLIHNTDRQMSEEALIAEYEREVENETSEDPDENELLSEGMQAYFEARLARLRGVENKELNGLYTIPEDIEGEEQAALEEAELLQSADKEDSEVKDLSAGKARGLSGSGGMHGADIILPLLLKLLLPLLKKLLEQIQNSRGRGHNAGIILAAEDIVSQLEASSYSGSGIISDIEDLLVRAAPLSNVDPETISEIEKLLALLRRLYFSGDTGIAGLISGLGSIASSRSPSDQINTTKKQDRAQAKPVRQHRAESLEELTAPTEENARLLEELLNNPALNTAAVTAVPGIHTAENSGPKEEPHEKHTVEPVKRYINEPPEDLAAPEIATGKPDLVGAARNVANALKNLAEQASTQSGPKEEPHEKHTVEPVKRYINEPPEDLAAPEIATGKPDLVGAARNVANALKNLAEQASTQSGPKEEPHEKHTVEPVKRYINEPPEDLAAPEIATGKPDLVGAAGNVANALKNLLEVETARMAAQAAMHKYDKEVGWKDLDSTIHLLSQIDELEDLSEEEIKNARSSAKAAMQEEPGVFIKPRGESSTDDMAIERRRETEILMDNINALEDMDELKFIVRPALSEKEREEELLKINRGLSDIGESSTDDMAIERRRETEILMGNINALEDMDELKFIVRPALSEKEREEELLKINRGLSDTGESSTDDMAIERRRETEILMDNINALEDMDELKFIVRPALSEKEREEELLKINRGLSDIGESSTDDMAIERRRETEILMDNINALEDMDELKFIVGPALSEKEKEEELLKINRGLSDTGESSTDDMAIERRRETEILMDNINALEDMDELKFIVGPALSEKEKEEELLKINRGLSDTGESSTDDMAIERRRETEILMDNINALEDMDELKFIVGPALSEKEKEEELLKINRGLSDTGESSTDDVAIERRKETEILMDNINALEDMDELMFTDNPALSKQEKEDELLKIREGFSGTGESSTDETAGWEDLDSTIHLLSQIDEMEDISENEAEREFLLKQEASALEELITLEELLDEELSREEHKIETEDEFANSRAIKRLKSLFIEPESSQKKKGH